MTRPRTALLMIRGWVEEGSSEPLRAHLRVTGDISQGIERTLTLTQADDVRALVDTWLVQVLEPEATAPTVEDRAVTPE